MKFEENKGALILIMFIGIMIGAWSVAITIAMLFLSLPVIVYSGIRHEPWLENFFVHYKVRLLVSQNAAVNKTLEVLNFQGLFLFIKNSARGTIGGKLF